MSVLRCVLTHLALLVASGHAVTAAERTRVIVTSDAEIDDQCSLVRFLLYANEWDIEGIITTSSQYRWQGHKWPGDAWFEPYLQAYAEVHPNLVKHDPAYPAPALLRARTVMGNAGGEGDMAAPSTGSELIVNALLDRSDPRPIWLQAWGGANTIARALKTIQEHHPDRMPEVAAKCRLFLIWEQDDTYQRYIRPTWGKLGILTIISDQFEAIAYRWKQAQPPELHRYFEGPWMRSNILRNRGPLTALYHAHENGDFRSEGDSPAFLHTIPTGLRSLESPDWGGWGGRYVRVRENTWLDPVPVADYAYPEGRWFGDNGWGRASLRPNTTSTPEQRARYFEPMWRWSAALQNDFAARAAWCVKSYADANHPPVVTLAHPQDLIAAPGVTVRLSARGTTDPDGDTLRYHWWHDADASAATDRAELSSAWDSESTATVPASALPGQTIHFICEVTDSGAPALTRYRRVVVTIGKSAASPVTASTAQTPLVVPPVTAHVATVSHGTLPAGATSIALASRAGFDFGHESFSLSFWLRWPRGLLPGGQYWLRKGAATAARYELFAAADSVRFAVSDGTNTSTLCVPLASFVTGEWVHVTAVRDREERRLRLYADGRLLTTNRPGNPALDGLDQSGALTNQESLIIGETGGEVTDLRFFRHALNVSQAAGLAARAPLVEQLPTVARTSPVAAPSELPPLVAHLPLTEGEGLAIHERITGLVGALLHADPDRAWTSSDRGLGLRFDGVDDRVEMPVIPGLDFAAEAFSVSFHVRWPKRQPSRVETLLSGGWLIQRTPTGLAFFVSDRATHAQLVVPISAELADQWIHVVAVRTTSDHPLRLYVNGTHPTPAPLNDRLAGSERTGDPSRSLPLLLGAGPAGANAFAGELADVRLYRAALTEAQVAAAARLRRHAAANPAEQSH